MMPPATTPASQLKIGAVADLHYTRHCRGRLQSLFLHARTAVDALLICGDLTDFGLIEEAEVLAADIGAHLSIPCFAVLGNHDIESGQAHALTAVFEKVGVQILDGECAMLQDVGLAGVCGFGGGFGSHMLNAWGEPLIKSFVQEAVDQALRLEKALARLSCEKKIALLHYSPIRSTVEGENPEIFPFLGSTRLEGPLNRHGVTMAFHGHAHRGSPEGATSKNIPVHNVSLPLLEHTSPGQPPLKVVRI